MSVLRFVQIASLIMAVMYSLLLVTYDGLDTFAAVFLIMLIAASIVLTVLSTRDIRHMDKGDR